MNCIGFIIDAVKSSNYEKLRYAASRTLCSLSAYSGLKSEILGLDAVNGLISAFDDPSASEDMKESILWTIRNVLIFAGILSYNVHSVFAILESSN